MTLAWSTAWTARRLSETALRLSAGSDRQLDIDGLNRADVDVIVQQLGGHNPRHHDGELARELEAQLVDLGVLVPAPLGATRANAGNVEVIGLDPSLDELAAQLGANISAQVPGLVVVLRRGPGAAVPDPQCLRLIVDVGAEHTLVVGPCVVPGRSSCESCLDRLLARRWEPAEQPARPAVTRQSKLIAAVVERHVQLIAEGRSPVINHTIALDLDTMTGRREPLLMSPRCPVCASPPADPRLELPWEAA